MNIEEAKEGLIRILNQTKIADQCGLSTNDFRTEIEVYETVLADLDKQDKIINAMALDMFCYLDNTIFTYKKVNSVKELKQYYEKKVSEE